MPIPQTIIDLIKIAKEQEVSEYALELLKDKKAEHLCAIALINEQIATQTVSVQTARAALKVAASKI